MYNVSLETGYSSAASIIANQELMTLFSETRPEVSHDTVRVSVALGHIVNMANQFLSNNKE